MATAPVVNAYLQELMKLLKRIYDLPSLVSPV